MMNHEDVLKILRENDGMKLETWIYYMKEAVHKGRKQDLNVLAKYLVQRYVIASVLKYKGYSEDNILSVFVNIKARPGSPEEQEMALMQKIEKPQDDTMGDGQSRPTPPDPSKDTGVKVRGW